ncbi:MAG: hypothetical protein LBT45_01860 [Rickettsiales bacterium]|jgi:hypothetical protein|nr:hypothetical protein [Rickettsiales bacterium]
MRAINVILQVVFFVLAYGATAANENSEINEIKIRFSASYEKAKSFCSTLPADIDKIKILAGIGIGAGATGTIAGGTALVAGIIKSKIDKLENMTAEQLLEYARRLEKDAGALEMERSNLAQKSKNMGNVRTAGAFVSGAGGIVGAASSFGGLKTLDALIVDMNACDSYVREIEKQAMELRFAAPDEPSLAKMSAIVKNCKGMSSKNIADIKSKIKAAGVISAVGAAAGVAGGITSAIATSNERQGASAAGAAGKDSTKGLNMAANISSGIAAAGGLGGAIISGAALSGLINNAELADKCAGMF